MLRLSAPGAALVQELSEGDPLASYPLETCLVLTSCEGHTLIISIDTLHLIPQMRGVPDFRLLVLGAAITRITV